jgi:hypothetical protein
LRVRAGVFGNDSDFGLIHEILDLLSYKLLSLIGAENLDNVATRAIPFDY